MRAIELPGRERRLREAPFQRIQALVAALLPALEPELGQKPFALLGHSMGARIAFELSLALSRNGLKSPEFLLLSGCPAPHLRDPRPKLHRLPDAEFLSAIEKLNGTPRAVLESAELMQLLLPRLRADYTLSETHVGTAEQRLSAPLLVVGGSEDEETSERELSAWAELSSGKLARRTLPGDHFFIHSAQSQLLDLLREEAARHGLRRRTAVELAPSTPSASDGNAERVSNARAELEATLELPRSTGPSTLLTRLGRHVERDAERTAFIYLRDGESCAGALSFGQLWHQSQRVAAGLAERYSAGARVLLFFPPGLEFSAAFLGCLQAGLVAVPLPMPRLQRTDERLRALIADASPVCALTHTGDLAARDRGRLLELPLHTLAEIERAPCAAQPARRPTELAYLQYTSGSTASPKGVMVSHANVLHNCSLFEQALGCTVDDRLLSWLPHFHDLGLVFGQLLPISVGFGACLLPPLSFVQKPLRWLRAISRYRATLSAAPNFAFDACIKSASPEEIAALDLSCLRAVINGAEPVRQATVAAFVDRFSPAGFAENALCPGYGLAEATLAVSMSRPDQRPEFRAVDPSSKSPLANCGSPTGRTRVQIVDPETRTRLPAGAVGEIWVESESVALGYFGNPEASAAVFQNVLSEPDGHHYLRTGDLGVLRDEGLFITGRLKDLLIVRGRNYYPQDIEATVSACHPAFSANGAAAFSVPGSDGEEQLVVFQELSREQRHAPPGELAQAIERAIFEDFGLPVRAVALLGPRRLPRTSSGKVRRSACRAAYLQGEGPWFELLELPSAEQREGAEQSTSLAAADVPSQIAAELERAIARLTGAPPSAEQWRAPLVDLGLQSLQALELVARLAELSGVELSLDRLLAGASALTLTLDLAASAGQPREAATSLRADPAAAHEPFPLTDVQQAYWIGRSPDLALGGVSCHGYLELRCLDLDEARLTHALSQLIARHPMLRAVISAEGEQRVLASLPPFAPAILDLRGLPEPEKIRQLLERRELLCARSFDTQTSPWFGLTITRLDARESRLHWDFELLGLDFASLYLVSSELEALYRDEPLEPLPAVSFRDYVQAERAARQGSRYQAALGYWRARAENFPEAPALPLARRPSELKNPRFVRRERRWPRARYEQLKECARAQRLSASGLLLAAFSEVIARWSERASFALAVTWFDRPPLHELARVVGDFTSILPLAIEAREDAPFATRAFALQKKLWRDLEHRQVSGVRVLREAQRGGGLPSLPVVFTSALGVAPADTAAPFTWLGEPVFTISQTPQVWLDHQAFEDRGELVLAWDAVDALFPAQLLDDMFTAYVDLLDRLCEPEGAAWQTRAPVRLPERQLTLRAQANATAAPVPGGLLHDGFLARARAEPAAIAVIAGEQRLCYGELDRQSSALAHALLSHGVARGELVGISLAKGSGQIVAALAILKAGAAYVPLDPSLPVARLSDMLLSAQVRLVIGERSSDRGSAWPAQIELLPLDASPAQAPTSADPRISPSIAGQAATDLAYVIFTSGSTGKPKGVMIDHRGALNTIADVNRRFAVGPKDRVLALSALSFDLSVYDVFGLLAAGGTIVFPEAERLRDPGHWLDLLSVHEVTLWNSVPALLEMLVEYCAGRGATLPRSLQRVLLSGDWIPVSLPARLRALSPELMLCSLGGATEASIWSIAYPIEQVDPSWKSIPYGKPLTNQTFHVFDKQLSPSPEWVAGDLYIGGVGVALGYIGDELRTQERFRVHPELGERLYWTGDLGRYLPDGNLEFLGRADLQVKIQGYRIELEEIEAALLGCQGVQAAAVLAEAAVSGGKRLVAYVAAQPGAPPTADALRSQLSNRLPSYMLPAAFCFLERLPLTQNGKIDRLRLAQTASRSASAAMSASSDLATSFLQLCRELLQRPELDREDNFFLSGGDSLLATRLSSRLREAHGIELKLAYVFDHPRIGDLLLELERLERAQRGAPRAQHSPALVASASDAEQPFPLTDVQYAYWLGRSRAFTLGGVACQGYVELDCEELDVERLQRALSRLVERHPMLRAVVDDSARQRVLATVSAAVPVRDLRGLSAAEQATLLAEERERWSHAILPSDRAPLFRMAVTRLSDSRSRVHWNVDLLILDYFSFKIVARELRELYESPERELPPIGLGFRDYVLYQKRQEQSAEYRASLDYWRARARELPPAPALPLVRQPSELSRVRFRRWRADLPNTRWQALRALASRWQLSASSLLLAAFAETLARHCRQPRFTLNVTLFDRAAIHPDVERVVGDFTTVTLLGVDWREPSFVERARALQRQLWRDLDHRRVSGVRVLGELSQSRGGGANAMPVVFTSTLRNEPAAEHAPLAWLGEEAFAVSQTPQVWLDHQLGEDERGLFLLWDAAYELFPEGFLDAMFESYLGLLNALADGLSEADGAASSAAISRQPAVPAPAMTAAAGTPEESLDKLQFKLERRGLRRDLGAATIPLVRPEFGAARQRELGLRRSFRQFVQEAVPSERLCALLSSLIQEQIPGLPFPKARYGSAGGLYPVQLYCSIKPERMRGLEGGSYYYDPDAHALVRLGHDSVPADLYLAVNAPVFQQAAFSLFLVADRLAIEPAYGAHWRDFALLEAGAICQLLESRAADHDLGLCQTGAVPFERVRADFGLHDARYVYLHGLLGGGIRAEQQTLADLVAELSPLNGAIAERARPTFPALAKLTPATGDSALEARLLALWSELLQRDDLSPDDHFFEAGGSSLLVVQLANRIREELGQEIPVLLLFEQPTVTLQAAYLRAQKSGPAAAAVAAAQHQSSPSSADSASDQQRRERLRRARLDLD